jgi:diamine N-acetyltransferase
MAFWLPASEPLLLASGQRAALGPMGNNDAQVLAEQFVDMEPWQSLGTSTLGLERTMLPSSLWQGRSWCLALDAKPIGAMVIRDDWLRGPFLTMFAVVPQYQRQGLARASLSWWEADARRNHKSNLWLSVSDFNVPARRLYEQIGFKPVAHLDGLLVDGLDEILMRKRLIG